MLYFTTLISQPVYSFSHKHQNQSFLQLTAVEVVALATISNSIILLTVQGLPESESQASAHLLVSLQRTHEAVELQQLQTEHEPALVALHTKQREINHLQKVWMTANTEHSK